MAKVQIQGPRLGLEFQGVSSMPVTYTWLDEAGTPITGDLPVIILDLTMTSAQIVARFTNDNDEAKTFSTPSGTGPSPITSVSVPSFTVLAKGSIDVAITVNFDGTQLHKDVSFIDLSGESDA